MENSSYLYQLVRKNRSYRRFDQAHLVQKQTLIDLVDLARLSASARNQQSLKYVLSNTEKLNQEIFSCLSWAGYLKDWPGPEEGEQPAAYIIILNDLNIAQNHFCDEGIAAQSILLGAIEKELGGCIIAAINKPRLSQILQLSNHLEILLVLALGRPIEDVAIEEVKNNNYEYWRDENQIHHVPKRSIEEIIWPIEK